MSGNGASFGSVVMSSVEATVIVSTPDEISLEYTTEMRLGCVESIAIVGLASILPSLQRSRPATVFSTESQCTPEMLAILDGVLFPSQSCQRGFKPWEQGL